MKTPAVSVFSYVTNLEGESISKYNPQRKAVFFNDANGNVLSFKVEYNDIWEHLPDTPEIREILKNEIERRFLELDDSFDKNQDFPY